MKLSEYCDKIGISYLTGWRWFKTDKLPVYAYQTDSGTILVEINDYEGDTMETAISSNSQSNDSMAQFLKKTVEFSKNNSTIEDFAAYVLSNFQLKLNFTPEQHPKYSKNKPKSEDIQKHFQKFLKPKGEKPKPNMLIPDVDDLDRLVEQADALADKEFALSRGLVSDLLPPSIDLMKDLSVALSEKSESGKSLNNEVKTYDSAGSDGIFNKVDLTPQSTNYTNSNSVECTDSDLLTFDNHEPDKLLAMIMPSASIVSAATTSAFKPTQKEIDLATKAMEKVANELHTQAVQSRRRGRKPSKKNV